MAGLQRFTGTKLRHLLVRNDYSIIIRHCNVTVKPTKVQKQSVRLQPFAFRRFVIFGAALR